jgi:entericidin A
MKRITLLALIVLSLLSACNTVSGFGEDLRQGGEGLQRISGRHGGGSDN